MPLPISSRSQLPPEEISRDLWRKEGLFLLSVGDDEDRRGFTQTVHQRLCLCSGQLPSSRVCISVPEGFPHPRAEPLWKYRELPIPLQQPHPRWMEVSLSIPRLPRPSGGMTSPQLHRLRMTLPLMSIFPIKLLHWNPCLQVCFWSKRSLETRWTRQHWSKSNRDILSVGSALCGGSGLG